MHTYMPSAVKGLNGQCTQIDGLGKQVDLNKRRLDNGHIIVTFIVAQPITVSFWQDNWPLIIEWLPKGLLDHRVCVN